MFRQIKSSVLFAVTIGVLMSCSTPALAGRQMAVAERYKNPSGDTTALCLRKIVKDYVVTRPQSDVFASCTPTVVGVGYVVIECTGGTVAAGDTARVAFFGTAASRKAGVVSAKWYSDASCSTLIDYAEPVPFIDVNTNGSVNVVVEHGAKEWTDPDGPAGNALGTIYGRDVQYAVTDYFRPLDELNEDLFTSISWTDMNECDFELTSLGATASCDLGAIDQSDTVLFRFYTGPSGTDNYELVQFCMSETCIPAVSQWGILVIALLLAAGGTMVIRRRRAMAA